MANEAGGGGKKFVTVQGYMSVESRALDDAFADTDVDPRQRLVSLEIDYLDDAVDVARCTFVDPDGRVGRAIRVGSTKIGDKLVYTPWTACIGYFGQDHEEMTSLTGVPMIEASNFPEDGEPLVTIKVMSASIAMQKNSTPGGGPQEAWGGTGSFSIASLRDAITNISLYYQLDGIDWGDSGMEDVIDEIDTVISGRLKGEHFDEELQNYLMGEGTPPRITCNFPWAKNDETDAKYLTRIAEAITNLVNSTVFDATTGFDQYFSIKMRGKPSKSDIKVVWGIYNNKLIFMFTRDYFNLIGVDRIPCLDYRVGNNLLRSFNPRTEATKAQGGFLSRIFAGLRGEESTIEDDADPIDPKGSPSDDIEATGINALLVNKSRDIVYTLPDGSAGTGYVDIATARRALDTDIKGEVTTYGDRHLIAGNLICLNGLPYGPMTEPKENEAQVFASYNRLYLIKQATHRMDDTGFYSAKIKVEGCSMDGSDETALKDLIKRLKAGIEGGAGDTGWAGFLDFLN